MASRHAFIHVIFRSSVFIVFFSWRARCHCRRAAAGLDCTRIKQSEQKNKDEERVLGLRGARFTKTFTRSHAHCKFCISRSSVTSLFIWLCIETLNRGGFTWRIETCTFRAFLFRSFSESAQPMGLILSLYDEIFFKLNVDNDFHIWHIHLSIFAFPQNP